MREGESERVWEGEREGFLIGRGKRGDKTALSPSPLLGREEERADCGVEDCRDEGSETVAWKHPLHWRTVQTESELFVGNQWQMG